MRRAIVLSIIFLACGLGLAQSPPDSLPVRSDTVFVIPAGPVAGSFTDAARMTVVDTVAGWAKIQLEGWVPVGKVLGRINEPLPATRYDGKPNRNQPTASSGECQALTKKGTRCKRKAMPGSLYCWQHQNYQP